MGTSIRPSAGHSRSRGASRGKWRARRTLAGLCLLALPALAAFAPVGAAGTATRDTAKVVLQHRGPAWATTSEPPAIAPRAGDTGPAPYLFTHWKGIAGGGSGGARPHPPDPHGAAGPEGIFATVNHSFVYFRRDGQALCYGSLNDIFGGVGTVLDPHAHYDRFAQRFYLTAIEPHPNSVLLHVAVSKSPDPRTLDEQSWFTYSVETSGLIGGVLHGGDYPTVGYDEQALYVSLNMFTLPFSSFPSFRRSRIFAFDKAQLANGVDVHRVIDTPDGAFTLQPATQVGPASAGNVAYFAEVVSYSTTDVRLWALSDPLGTPSLASAQLAVPNHGGQSEGAPQCTAPRIRISTFSPRAQGNAFWRDGRLWFCHTAGGSAGRAIVFYYDLATNGFPSGAPAVGESGAIDGGPGVWLYQPAIGGNTLGDVGLVFTRSSPDECPAVAVTARRAGATAFPDPLVAFTSPVYYDGSDTLFAGTDRPYARWGDYASVTADPFDESLWFVHETAMDGDDRDLWGTRWVNVQFPYDGTGWAADGLVLRASAMPATSPVAVADGTGGAFVAWLDQRESAGAGVGQVTLSRVLADGSLAPGWPHAGRVLGPSTGGTRAAYSALADGAGGVIVTWCDADTTRVQRLTGAAVPASGWPAGGIALASGYVSHVQLASDGAGGALLAWGSPGIRVQRVTAGGGVLWAAGGVSLATGGGLPQVVSDGAGGAVVAWAPSARVQHVSAAGTPTWTAGGRALAIGATPPRLAPDAAGGAYVGFLKSKSDLSGSEVRLLRIESAAGGPAPGWPASGTVVSPAGDDAAELAMLADGAGGVLLAWSGADAAATSGFDLRVARVGAGGAAAPGWPATGVTACAAPGEQTMPALAAHGDGGAVVFWTDGRGTDADLYAHVFDAHGRPFPTLPADGVAICAAPGAQSNPGAAIVGEGSAIVAWEDGRLVPGCDPAEPCGTSLVAQRFAFDPTVSAPPGGGAPARVSLAPSAPNPSTGAFTVRFGIPAGSAGQRYELSLFDLAGRRVAVLAAGTARAGHQVAAFDGRDRGRPLQPGTYFIRLEVGGTSARRTLVLVR